MVTVAKSFEAPIKCESTFQSTFCFLFPAALVLTRVSVSQWCFLRTYWRKDWRPVTSPCWDWETSSSRASSSPCCCASTSGSAQRQRPLSLHSIFAHLSGPVLVSSCPHVSVCLQPEEEQQDVLLLQLPGLHLRSGPHHLRHAHLQTRTGRRRGQML